LKFERALTGKIFTSSKIGDGFADAPKISQFPESFGAAIIGDHY